jgi:large subunit ribosomal protein L15
MNLATLKPAKGARTSRKRVGRGPGSGLGTTAGRGNKGHQARSGYSSSKKEGGQMPIYRRLPKFGFTNPNRKPVRGINLSQIAALVKKGVLTETITLESLNKAGVIAKTDYFKVLGEGDGVKLNITAHYFSEAAKEKLEKAGSKLTVAVRTLAEAGTMKSVELAKAVVTPKRDVNEYKKAIRAEKKKAAAAAAKGKTKK